MCNQRGLNPDPFEACVSWHSGEDGSDQQCGFSLCVGAQGHPQELLLRMVAEVRVRAPRPCVPEGFLLVFQTFKGRE